MEDTQRRWLNTKEAAEYMRISYRSLYNRISQKTKDPFPIECKRLGGRILFDRLAIDTFLESL